MMKNRKKLSKIIGLPIFFFLIVGIIIYTQYWDKKIEEAEKVSYFIGKIKDFEVGAKVSPWFEYKYTAYGKKYTGRKDLPSKLPNPYRSYIGKRYYVKVLPDHPKVSRMMLDKPVPSHIKKAPMNGWKKIPPTSPSLRKK